VNFFLLCKDSAFETCNNIWQHILYTKALLHTHLESETKFALNVPLVTILHTKRGQEEKWNVEGQANDKNII
jgi:hypothetical protein